MTRARSRLAKAALTGLTGTALLVGRAAKKLPLGGTGLGQIGAALGQIGSNAILLQGGQ